MALTIDFSDWVDVSEAQRERVRTIEAAFSEPYRRERARDPEEAYFLRLRGTPEHLIGLSSDDTARRAFAAPGLSGFFGEIDLSLLDPEDPDDRRLLIEAEHPEFVEALERDSETVVVDGEEVDPRLHLTLHEIVSTQLWENEPPAVWQTARGLLEAGYERHEILHMLGSALVPQFWRVLGEGKPTDLASYVQALDALPGSWEDERKGRRRERPLKRKLAAKARKAERQARKRNRRRR